MASRADLIFTVSEFSKSKICLELDVTESKVQVVYNGVNEIFFSDKQPTSDLSLPDTYLLYVGALSTRKNISGLLQAFRILKEDYDIEHKLVLIGPEDDPTNESDIDPQMIDPIREDIIQLGYVTDEELKEAYTAADIFVFPSYYEGFGIPPLEAMACGTPVVASDRTAIPEVLGDAAEYVDPDHPESISEGVVNILTDPDLSKTLTDKGQSQSEQFQWTKSAKKLYKTLSDRKKQNNPLNNRISENK
jgi:glycosyltransferase involved in cell wall biosynthesis